MWARALALTILFSSCATAQAADLRIACASNFKRTLQELAPRFESGSGHRLRISSASTGVLFNQIVHGAPFDVFLAADSERPRLLEERGLTLAGSRTTYALGDLVLAYQDSLAPQPQEEAATLLQEEHLSLVIANPDHAPYGVAAASVLARFPPAGSSRLLRAANVSQAYQMWYTGGVDLALVARSFQPANFLELPPNSHKPVAQQAVVLARADARPARALLDFLASEAAQEIILAAGYRVPGENR